MWVLSLQLYIIDIIFHKKSTDHLIDLHMYIENVQQIYSL
jgi:hypothetical protein